MRNQVLLGLFVLFLIFPFYSFGKVEVFYENDEYEIQGSSIQELQKEMDTKGKIKDKNRVYDAYTSWHLQWAFGIEWRKDRCGLKNIQIFTRIHRKFPKWKNQKQASLKLQQHWKFYFQALKEHHNVHRDLGIAAAKKIEKLLAKVEHPDCNYLNVVAGIRARNIIKQFVLTEIEYDKFTDYGKKTGAKLE
ncbi:MAG: putative secreted Zn-dependent protease [bacterium]